MEEILDQAFHEKEKDETRINRGIVLIRLAVCIGFLYILVTMLNLFNSSDSFEMMLNVVFYTIVAIVIIHNIFRAASELRHHIVVSRNNRIYILVVILIQLILIALLSGFLYFGLIGSIVEQKYPFSIRHVVQMAIILCLTIITIREITYYQRATRLKRLKNTKP